MSEKIVNPEIYDTNYYLFDNEGCHEYRNGLDNNIHPKFSQALQLAGRLAPGSSVLDVGCGRGELLYYCAKSGIKALGIDYSKAAVEIARETIKMLPKEAQGLVSAQVADAATYDYPEKYDVIFMLEILEHLNDTQLKQTLNKFKEILKDEGKLIITTPNFYYEKYLDPIKRVLDLPFRFLKWTFRILRGKYKPKSFSEFCANAFKIKASRGERSKEMHCNVSTPAKIKKLLSGFEARVICLDHSLAPISLLTRKWWGRQIIAIAKKKI